MDDFSYFLKEDLQDIGDITSDALFTDETAKGIITVKTDCILAGLAEAEHVFSLQGANLESLYRDGEFITQQSTIATVQGPVRAILSAERLALNILGRMSGIATETKKLVDKCRVINPKVTIAATRKTTQS